VPGQSFGIKRNTLAPADEQFRRSVGPQRKQVRSRTLESWVFRTLPRLFWRKAEKRGIVVEITLFTSHYGEAQWKLSPFECREQHQPHTDAVDWKKLHTIENGKSLGLSGAVTRVSWCVRRTASTNVIFEIQNEPWAGSREVGWCRESLFASAGPRYISELGGCGRRGFDGVAGSGRGVDSKRGVAACRRSICWRRTSATMAFPVRDVPAGIDVLNFHYAYPEAVQWNYGLGKAISYDESGFLGWQR